MKKLFSLLFVALLATTAWASTVVTFDPTTVKGSTTGNTTPDSMTKDGVTISCTDAAFATDEYRFYAGSTATISSTAGNITKVVFTCTANNTTKYGPGCFQSPSTGTYTYDAKVGTWEGNAGSFTLSANAQVRATLIEVTIGGEVQPTVADPVFSPVSGTSFEESLEVSMSCSTPNAQIWYTTDGENLLQYIAPITITETTTFSAFGYLDGVNSKTVEATYTKISGETPDGPIVFDASVDGSQYTTAGAYSITKNGVTLSVSNGMVSSGLYRMYKSADVTVSSVVGNITKVVFDCASGNPASGFGENDGLNAANGTWTGDAATVALKVNNAQVRASTVTVTIDGEVETTVALPVFTPASGTSFDESLEVSLSCVTSDADIYYAIDDAEPALYTAPFTITESCTVSAYATKNGVQGETATATYTKNDVVIGEPIVFDHTVDTGDAGSEAGPYSVTKDGVTFAVSNGMIGEESYRIYKNETINFTSTAGHIVKVEFTCTASGDAKYGPGCFGNITDGNYAYNGQVGTWQGTSANFSLTASTNQVRASEIRVWVDGEVLPVIVAIPTFEPAGNTRFAGTQQVAISCETEGATIYYSTDNENYTEYTAPITITETTTVYAYAQVGDVKGPKASATYTKITEVSTIAAANALADNTYFSFVPDGVVVVYQNGSNLWVRDDSGYGLIYGFDLPTFEQGTLLSDAWEAQKVTYNGFAEFKNPVNVTDSGDDKVEVMPTECDADSINADMVHQYLLIKNQILTPADTIVRSWTNAAGLKFYNQFQLDLNIEEDKAYDMVGIVTLYKGEVEVYIVSATEVAEQTVVRGDVNGDDSIDPSDISALIDYLLNGSQVNENNADCDQNGSIDPGDISALIDYLLNNVWPM